MISIRRSMLSRSIRNNWSWFFLTVVFCIMILMHRFGMQYNLAFNMTPFQSVLKFHMTPVDVYAHASKLKVDNTDFPACAWSIGRQVQYCAGYCPWVSTNLVKCEFMPRVVNRAFNELGMYCVPPDDNCPTYNAYKKDTLPLTKQLIPTIPPALVSNFTLDGLIAVNYAAGHDFINTSLVVPWTQTYIDGFRRQVKGREAYGTYKTTDLYPVLDTYAKIAVQSKKCAVVGTIYPWIEAALLEYGAGSVLTIEYAKITASVSGISTITPGEYAEQQERLAKEGKFDKFDSVWSYSSIEHDGLGRFTDPINPDGDFQTMVKISCMLKPGGFLFLAIPTNKKDTIFFNLHRVYGPVRYPLIFRYFHLVQAFINEVTSHPEQHNQPILVLQNKVGCQ